MRKTFLTSALIVLILVVIAFTWFYLFGRSYVDLTLSGDTLNASFKVSKLDSVKVEQLSRQLSLGDDWQKGVRISLNPDSAKKLSPYLPKRAYLVLFDKRLVFKTFSFHKLQNPTVSLGEGFSFESDQPSDDLSLATSSGELKVSPKIEKVLWNLSDKLDRIKIRLDKESLEGEVVIN